MRLFTDARDVFPGRNALAPQGFFDSDAFGLVLGRPNGAQHERPMMVVVTKSAEDNHVALSLHAEALVRAVMDFEFFGIDSIWMPDGSHAGEYVIDSRRARSAAKRK